MPYPATADPASVTRLLVSEGYTNPTGSQWLGPDGKPFMLKLAVDGSDTWAVHTGRLVTQELEAQGIGVSESELADITATGTALASGAADMALIPYASTPYPTQAIAWYTTILGPPGVDGSQDWMNYTDPAVAASLTKAAQQLNPVQAAPIYAQADLTLWNSMITLPLFAEPASVAWSNHYSGIGANPYGSGLLWFPETWGIRVPPNSPDTAG
jgi:peptide/nickel transport system substrate-binding protein